MTDNDILISDLNDISEILNNNGYGGWCATIRKAVSLLKEQEWKSKRLTPTEPKVSINGYGVKFYYCPHCSRPIIKSAIIGRPRHCEACGQEMKWNNGHC